MYASSVTAPVRAVTGELHAAQVGEIVREHGRYVWRVLRYLGVHQADLPDASQEVFVVVHRRLSDFEGRSTLRTWLYAICARTASSFRRRQARRRDRPSDLPPEPIAPAEQIRAIERTEARQLLLDLLDELDEEKRAVYVLHEVEQMPAPEVAEALGIPLGTAFSRLRAARQKLDKALKRRRAKEVPA